MIRTAAAAVLLIAIAACATRDPYAGHGPVKLSAYQKKLYRLWSHAPASQDPLYFFLVNDGTAYPVTCSETVGLCVNDTEREWLHKCEAAHGMGACKLYGVYGQVVWDFSGGRDPNWTNYTRRKAPTGR